MALLLKGSHDAYERFGARYTRSVELEKKLMEKYL